MNANNPETIYSAGSGDWTQARLIPFHAQRALCQWATEINCPTVCLLYY